MRGILALTCWVTDIAGGPSSCPDPQEKTSLFLSGSKMIMNSSGTAEKSVVGFKADSPPCLRERCSGNCDITSQSPVSLPRSQPNTQKSSAQKMFLSFLFQSNITECVRCSIKHIFFPTVFFFFLLKLRVYTLLFFSLNFKTEMFLLWLNSFKSNPHQTNIFIPKYSLRVLTSYFGGKRFIVSLKVRR